MVRVERRKIGEEKCEDKRNLIQVDNSAIEGKALTKWDYKVVWVLGRITEHRLGLAFFGN